MAALRAACICGGWNSSTAAGALVSENCSGNRFDAACLFLILIDQICMQKVNNVYLVFPSWSFFRCRQEFDGRDEATPSYVALRGEVFDVSSKPEHYKKGGGYHLFAGHDASYSLALGSLDPADLDKRSALFVRDAMRGAGGGGWGEDGVRLYIRLYFRSFARSNGVHPFVVLSYFTIVIIVFSLATYSRCNTSGRCRELCQTVPHWRCTVSRASHMLRAFHPSAR